MNTSRSPQLHSDDELFRLERRIARRADELSRLKGCDRGHALDHWRQAEREIWDACVQRMTAPATAAAH